MHTFSSTYRSHAIGRADVEHTLPPTDLFTREQERDQTDRCPDKSADAIVRLPGHEPQQERCTTIRDRREPFTEAIFSDQLGVHERFEVNGVPRCGNDEDRERSIAQYSVSESSPINGTELGRVWTAWAGALFVGHITCFLSIDFVLVPA
jgi:hypothetical protein